MKVRLEKGSMEVFGDYFMLRNDSENVYWTGYKNAPDRDSLQSWFERQLLREERRIYLAWIKGEPKQAVGYLYLDKAASGENAVEISYGVHSSFKGRGVGTDLVGLSVELAPDIFPQVEWVCAWILETNSASIKCVTRNGFARTGEKKEMFLESLDGKAVMARYALKIRR